MASLMESYEQQYANLTAEITAKTGSIPHLSGGEKRALANQVEKHIEEVQELLEQMELEIREINGSDRIKYQKRLKSYEDQLEQLQKELRKAKIAYRDEISTRDELLNDNYSVAEEQKQSLLDNTERLERCGRKLEAGYKMTVETENIGAEVLEHLSGQRETIQRSRNRLREADDEIGKSSRILNAMMRRIMQNRVLLLFIGVFMVGVLIFAIYLIAKR